MTKHGLAVWVTRCGTCGAHCTSGEPVGNIGPGGSDASSDGVVLCAPCRELFVAAGLVPFVSPAMDGAQRVGVARLREGLAARRLLNGWGVRSAHE